MTYWLIYHSSRKNGKHVKIKIGFVFNHQKGENKNTLKCPNWRLCVFIENNWVRFWSSTLLINVCSARDSLHRTSICLVISLRLCLFLMIDIVIRVKLIEPCNFTGGLTDLAKKIWTVIYFYFSYFDQKLPRPIYYSVLHMAVSFCWTPCLWHAFTYVLA